MIIPEEVYLAHYGTPRHSGRYPWGSGGEEMTGSQRSMSFLDYVNEHRAKGLSDGDIAKGMGLNSTEFRIHNSIAKNAQKQADIAQATRLKAKGMSNVEIGKSMGRNESSVRSLLNPQQEDRNKVLHSTSNMLREQVAAKGYIDVGKGVANRLGISKEKLATAVAVLVNEGNYVQHPTQIDQLGVSGGKKTVLKVLAPKGTTYADIAKNQDKIRQIDNFSDDGGRTFLGIQPPLNVSSKRVSVVYGAEGAKADGMIYLRPGVKDISLGGARYAQVRIAVDGTHYLKGMAIHKDGLPPGVDLQFHTPKASTGNKLDAMKSLKDDPENPFGSFVRQQIEHLADGSKRVTSALNIVNEEGKWESWADRLSSQFLSKQQPTLAEAQLAKTHDLHRKNLDEILALTNPAVKAKLLESFASGADSSAVHLEAAALPRQGNHVILPIKSMKDTEVYAPNFNDGDRVVLIRHPHGGIFEIPELTVNNRQREAKKLLGNARDAVGINSEVAKKLSGADFDGDTVLVIPNNNRRIKTAPTLEGLKHFDAQRAYPAFEGMPKMTARQKGIEMGGISNLITDMTIKKASMREIAQAVRHSMVVIDAEKHNLNYKQSALDNNIAALKAKYQGKANAGASTLISKATSEKRVPVRELRKPGQGGPIDPKTGRLVYVTTAKPYTVQVVNKKTGAISDRIKTPTLKSSKLAETHDAHSLSSGTKIEAIYADHSNRLKALANEARLATLKTKPILRSPSAAIAYHSQVKSLDHKLNAALQNAPLERQAQIFAAAAYKAKIQANPNMSEADKKKIRYLALEIARARTNAGKQQIEITTAEWAAIQAGAISNTKLNEILRHANLDIVKQLATPKTTTLMTPAKQAKARALAVSGATQAEIASALGVSLTTLKRSLSQ